MYNRRQMLGIGGEEQRDGTITLRGRAHRALTVAWTPRDGRVHVAGGPGHRPSRAERAEIADRIAGAVRDFAVIAAKAGTIIITLDTEEVTENYQPAPGRMDSRRVWYAYRPHVAGYGHVADRAAMVLGRGATEEDAIWDARLTVARDLLSSGEADR